MNTHASHQWIHLSPYMIPVRITERQGISPRLLDAFFITDVCAVRGCTAGRDFHGETVVPDIRPQVIFTKHARLSIERARW